MTRDTKPEISIHALLDASGMLCPMPVLKLRRELDTLAIGEKIRLIATDPATVRDVPAFCTMAGHSIVYAEDSDQTYEFIIAKGA